MKQLKGSRNVTTKKTPKLTHPAINPSGCRTVLRDIFNVHLPCFRCLVFSPLNTAATIHCYILNWKYNNSL